MGEFFT